MSSKSTIKLINIGKAPWVEIHFHRFHDFVDDKIHNRFCVSLFRETDRHKHFGITFPRIEDCHGKQPFFD